MREKVFKMALSVLESSIPPPLATWQPRATNCEASPPQCASPLHPSPPRARRRRPRGPGVSCFRVRVGNAPPRVILTPVPDADRHIDDDDLERYVLDQLSEDEAAPIDEHLLACQECQDRLVQVNQRVQAMRASRRRLG